MIGFKKDNKWVGKVLGYKKQEDQSFEVKNYKDAGDAPRAFTVYDFFKNGINLDETETHKHAMEVKRLK